MVALATFAGASLFDERRAQARLIRDRLATVQKAPEREPDEELALVRDEQLSKFPALDTLLRRSARVSALQDALLQAGMRFRAGNFLAMCAIAAPRRIRGFGLHQKSRHRLGRPHHRRFLPYPWCPIGVRSALKNSRSFFPEAIDTLARAVRAGHAFTTALEMISNEISEPLASEFRQLFEEQKFGMPVRDALMNLADRVPMIDIKFFVTAVMLQRETGGNIAEILGNLSSVIRERFKLQRQVRVHTAQGRLTMALLMGMPPAVLAILWIFSPDFVKPLFYDPYGHVLLVLSITLQTIGYFVIRKIIKIQV